MPNDHAILSPSGAERWLNCTPSARLEEQFPDTESEAAREGTLAHLLAETILNYRTAAIDKAAYKAQLIEIEAHELYKEEMYEYCDQYAVYVLEQYAEARAISPEAILFVEQQLDLSAYIEDGFGTNDNSILSPRLLHVIDFKYGKGVVVSAVRSRQMMLYALGVLERCGFLFDVEVVKMSIYQPRVSNYSNWEISVEELRHWANTELKELAALAYAGEGEFVAGKHCEFCRARARCRANSEYNLEIARHEFRDPVLLEDEEIADILKRLPMFVKWAGAVEEMAFIEATKNGKKWPGWKLVEGRSRRIYLDEALIGEKLLGAGYRASDIFSPAKLFSITKLEEAIGKRNLDEQVGKLIHKPRGAPTLVPEEDKRVELNSVAAAVSDFEGIDVDTLFDADIEEHPFLK